VALAFCFIVLLNPVFLPYGALLNATFSKVASQFVSFSNFTFHNIYFVFFELSATKLALYNTFVLGIATATIGTVIAVVISYLTTREAVTGHKALGFLATAPVAIPGIVLGVGLFLSYTRRRSCSTARSGFCWRRFLTQSLPAPSTQQMAVRRFAHPSGGGDASRILARRGCGAAGDQPRRCSNLGDRHLVLRVRRHIRELVGRHMLFTSGDQGDSVLIFDPSTRAADLAAISVLARHHHAVVTFGIVALANTPCGMAAAACVAGQLISMHFPARSALPRRVGAKGFMDASFPTSPLPKHLADAHRRRRRRQAAGGGAREMRGDADRRRRPLHRRAQRGLRPGALNGWDDDGPAPRSAISAR
jgi:hypothetical protein